VATEPDVEERAAALLREAAQVLLADFDARLAKVNLALDEALARLGVDSADRG
jgi:hypothetical protein